MEPQREDNPEFSEMLDGLKQHFTSYIATCYELFSLKAVQKISAGATSMLIMGMVSLFVLFLLLFASIGMAILINEGMTSTFAGFFIVAGLYAILALLLYVFRKGSMRKSIQDGIISEMLKD
jgi:hypothetical protein